MILHIRHGASMIEVRVPEGSLVQFTAAKRAVLLIPGPTPQDTAAWLSAASIVVAARIGRYGLSLVAETRGADPLPQPKADRRAAG
jgi:hypothetical protein